MKMGRSVTQGFLVAGSLLLAIGLLSGTALADDDDDDKDKTKGKIVKCGKGKTIGKALEKGNKRKPLVIIVQGPEPCKENVIITRDDVTLRGDKDVGGTVTASDPDRPTILIEGAHRVVIDYLTVSGGKNGINGVGGADFTVQNSTIRDNERDGVRVAGGSAVIIGNEILANTRHGVNVTESGTARIGLSDRLETGLNVIANNQDRGISITNGASGIMFGNTIEKNATDGILIARAIGHMIGENTVQENRSGVLVASGGVLRQGPAGFTIGGRDIVQDNTGVGILALQNASLDIRDAAISNNGSGIVLDLHSTLRIRNSDIMENSGNGIQLSRDSGLSLENPVVRITGNGTGPFGGFGIFCGDSESSFVGNFSEVVGNKLGDVSDMCTDFNQVGMFPPPPPPPPAFP